MSIKPRKLDQGSKVRKPSSVVKDSSFKELLYYGQHICSVLSLKRRSDIIRVYCTEARLPQFGSLLQWCAKNRKAYHVVTEDVLEKVTGSVHHEGVAVLAKAPHIGSCKELLGELRDDAKPVMFLDGVQNPHNIGTIMRVMAHFGWPYLVGSAHLPHLTGAAARMSEGGAESVTMFQCSNVAELFTELKNAGYRVVGTSSHTQQSLYSVPLPKKTVLVLGGEVEGMTKQIEALIDESRSIPGSGQVESLNVSVACGLFLGEYTRLYGIS
jgi:TrmH RNA methyltransferase